MCVYNFREWNASWTHDFFTNLQLPLDDTFMAVEAESHLLPGEMLTSSYVAPEWWITEAQSEAWNEEVL